MKISLKIWNSGWDTNMMWSYLEEEGKQALQAKLTTCDGLETGKCDGCNVKKNQPPLHDLGELHAHEISNLTQFLCLLLLGHSVRLFSTVSIPLRPLINVLESKRSSVVVLDSRLTWKISCLLHAWSIEVLSKELT